MARFCLFWRMTPAEYKQLTLEERAALIDEQNDYIREQNRKNKR